LLQHDKTYKAQGYNKENYQKSFVHNQPVPCGVTAYLELQTSKQANLRLPTEAGENTNQSSSGAQGQFLNIAPIAEKNSNAPIFAYKTGGERRLFVQPDAQ